MHLEVSPITAINAPLPIRVEDLDPGADVQIALSCTDTRGHVFESRETFHADSTGRVDTATMWPASAAWHPAESRGLCWVMNSPGNLFCLPEPQGITLNLTVRAKGQPGVSTSVQRIFHRRVSSADLPDAVRDACAAKKHDAITGGDTSADSTTDCHDLQLYLPETKPNAHTVLLIGDATGSVPAAAAAELAGEGFTTYAASWVPTGSSPCDVRRCARIVKAIAESAGHPIALIGMGRGAELALMLASWFGADTRHPASNPIGPVVAHSPSDLRTQQPHHRHSTPSWYDSATSEHDEAAAAPEATPLIDSAASTAAAAGIPSTPIPTAALRPAASSGFGEDLKHFLRPRVSAKPQTLAAEYHTAREEAQGIGEYRIECRSISTPLLLSAGDSDPVWAASASCDRILEQMTTADPEALVYVVQYEDAGYGIGYPFSFAGLPQYHVAELYGEQVEVGGSPASRGAAAVASQEQVLSFLRSAFDALEDQPSGE